MTPRQPPPHFFQIQRTKQLERAAKPVPLSAEQHAVHAEHVLQQYAHEGRMESDGMSAHLVTTESPQMHSTAEVSCAAEGLNH